MMGTSTHPQSEESCSAGHCGQVEQSSRSVCFFAQIVIVVITLILVSSNMNIIGHAFERKVNGYESVKHIPFLGEGDENTLV